MSEVKHSPSPWSALFPVRINGGCGVVRAANGRDIATIHEWDEEAHCGLPDLANGPLMAAAPELLEALKEVVAISDRKHDAWDKARAAIAKAEGDVQ